MSSVAQKQTTANGGFQVRRLSDESLWESAGRMSRILEAGGLSARLTVEGRSVDVGKSPKGQHPSVEFVFSSIHVYGQLMSNVRLYTFAKAYFDEKINIIGPFEEAINVLYQVNLATDTPSTLQERLSAVLFRTLKVVIPFVAMRFESDAHYSMSDRAYGLFLDGHMQYTCAKFIAGDEDLDKAQINKFQLIKELSEQHIGTLSNLKHLDIGCGWGGLVHYFEKYFNTISVGNTNNASQRDYATTRFRANVIFGDFSVLRKSVDRYGLITAVGILEHLTPHRRSQLLRVAKSSLARGGILYLQCIGKPNVWIGGDSYRIAYEDVFPGHQLETRGQMEARFRKLGFEVLYAADDASDYAKTTALWVKNIQENRREIVQLIGEKNYRIFLGYLAYASKLFASDRGSLMRYLLQRRD